MIYSLFYRHNSSCTVFWVSSFHLSVNNVVLYQFTVPGHAYRKLRILSWSQAWVEASSLSDGKKVQDCDYVFGSSTTFEIRKEWICESRCRQVSVRLHHYLRDFSTTTISARSPFYPSLRFTLSLQSAFYTQFAFYPWSAVCSPQSAVRSPQSSFYTDRLFIPFSFACNCGKEFFRIQKWRTQKRFLTLR